jgi:hypothetical protein
VRPCVLSLLKLLGAPSLICEVYDAFRIEVPGGGGDTDVGGGIATLFAFSVLIIVNNCVISLFVHLVASPCLRSPSSRLWSRSASIAIVR